MSFFVNTGAHRKPKSPGDSCLCPSVQRLFDSAASTGLQITVDNRNNTRQVSVINAEQYSSAAAQQSTVYHQQPSTPNHHQQHAVATKHHQRTFKQQPVPVKQRGSNPTMMASPASSETVQPSVGGMQRQQAHSIHEDSHTGQYQHVYS